MWVELDSALWTIFSVAQPMCRFIFPSLCARNFVATHKWQRRISTSICTAHSLVTHPVRHTVPPACDVRSLLHTFKVLPTIIITAINCGHRFFIKAMQIFLSFPLSLITPFTLSWPLRLLLHFWTLSVPSALLIHSPSKQYSSAALQSNLGALVLLLPQPAASTLSSLSLRSNSICHGQASSSSASFSQLLSATRMASTTTLTVLSKLFNLISLL